MMAIIKEHIRYHIHLAFHFKKNIAEVAEMTCTAYGDNAVSYATCKIGKKFRAEDFNLKD